MKQILLFLLIAVWSTLSFGQNIFVLDSQNNPQLSGWQISGNNISMLSDYAQGDYFGLIVDIENPTQNLETFTLKSLNFNLYANQLYNLEFNYVYAFFDAMMGDSQIDELYEVILKDGNGNVIQHLSLQDNPSYQYNGFAKFFVVNTGNYYLEFIGKIQNVTHEMRNQKYAGFQSIYLYEDNNKFSVSGRVKYDINNDNCSTSTQFLKNFSIKSNPSISNNSFYSKTNINGNYITSFNEINTYTIQPDYNLITSNLYF